MMGTKDMTVSHSFPEIFVPLQRLLLSFHAFDHVHGLNAPLISHFSPATGNILIKFPAKKKKIKESQSI